VQVSTSNVLNNTKLSSAQNVASNIVQTRSFKSCNNILWIAFCDLLLLVICENKS